MFEINIYCKLQLSICRKFENHWDFVEKFGETMAKFGFY